MKDQMRPPAMYADPNILFAPDPYPNFSVNGPIAAPRVV